MRTLALVFLLCACGSKAQTQGNSQTTPLTPQALCNAASDIRFKCSPGQGLTDHDVTACVTGVTADANERRYWECVIGLSCNNEPASCSSGVAEDCLHIRCESGKTCLAGTCK